MTITARQLCEILGGELVGDPDIQVSRPSKIEEADEGSLTFLANPKYEQYAYETRASVLLVNRDFNPSKPITATLIRVDDVYRSLGILLESFNGEDKIAPGVSDLAFIHETATLEDGVAVGPFVYVGPGAVIGSGSVIYPHVFIGRGAKVGAGTKLYSGVRLYHGCNVGERCVIHANSVIGSDGFGFSRGDNGVFSKIAQVGNVVIENEVEIGANTVIDRATMGSTVIRSGAKLDNLIQVAHNVEIGENTAMAAQAGVAGSAKIGKNVLIGGQVGVSGHIKVADGVQIAAQSGLMSGIEDEGERVMGSPTLRYVDFLKSYSIFRNLPALQRRINELEKELSQLKGDKA